MYQLQEIAEAPVEGRRRVVVEAVTPDVPGFPVKRILGEAILVEADVFADGHDQVSAALQYRHERDNNWQQIPMAPLGNDRWAGNFVLHTIGRNYYRVLGWVDDFRTWLSDLRKKLAADQDVHVELLSGALMVEEAAARAAGEDKESLQHFAGVIRRQADAAFDPALLRLVQSYPDLSFASYSASIELWLDDRKAGFSAWYELFPRSWGKTPGRHGSLRELAEHLPYVAGMGFDVLYLPPIHPIGRSYRKGRNNAVSAQPEDPGSPWAIGNESGGHKSISPELGTMDDFEALVYRAGQLGLEVALDIAFQCSPDHPYVHEHPQWFKWRPDNTIQYAENPPKKYEDIYPLNFDCDDWPALWQELRSIFLFWLAHGVRIFRVDNPHTKPFSFWRWVIAEVKKQAPHVIFLAEAFTRPKIMYRLAKLGFTQSYTYFTWRNTKHELAAYFQELAAEPVVDFFRPNLWPNTPDILHEYLQHGGRPAFSARLILAATLGSNYGIYGPAFELMEAEPRHQGSEEYLHSEKYEVRAWNLGDPSSLRRLITDLNSIRREQPALQRFRGLRFHETSNERILCYSKSLDDGSRPVLCVVNLDPVWRQSALLDFSPGQLSPQLAGPYQVEDLLTGRSYRWEQGFNYVELDPRQLPAHIFAVTAA